MEGGKGSGKRLKAQLWDSTPRKRMALGPNLGGKILRSNHGGSISPHVSTALRTPAQAEERRKRKKKKNARLLQNVQLASDHHWRLKVPTASKW